MPETKAREFIAIGLIVGLIAMAGCTGFLSDQNESSPETVSLTEASLSSEGATPTSSAPTLSPATNELGEKMPPAEALPSEYVFLGTSDRTEETGQTLVHDFEYTGSSDQQFPARLTISIESFNSEADTKDEFEAIQNSLEDSYETDLEELNLTDGPAVRYIDLQLDEGDHFAGVVFRHQDTVVLVLAEDTTDFDSSPLFETSRIVNQRLAN